jgi:hypothetical protein
LFKAWGRTVRMDFIREGKEGKKGGREEGREGGR